MKWKEYEEEDVTTYLMTLRKVEDKGNWKTKHWVAIYGELPSKEAMDLSQDRLHELNWTFQIFWSILLKFGTESLHIMRLSKGGFCEDLCIQGHTLIKDVNVSFLLFPILVILFG
jgi:hypothetical protein